MATTVARPSPGQLVRVRARRWLVEQVAPGRHSGEQTFVRLAGVDDDNRERSAALLWERELDAEVLEDEGWQRLGRLETEGVHVDFDEPDLFAAFLRTLRWHTVTAADPELFQAPFRAGIKIEPYQLEPLAKALRLPRVNLLIADDVGLGKTIEAGLILRELMLRRRVDRVVIAAPPAMLHQWRQEMQRRFGLDFEVLDRTFLRRIRKERGFSVNPWTTHPRFLISHRLLVDTNYTQGLRDLLGDFTAKTMLILDEAHHAAPASGQRFAIDSQFTRAVRDLAGRFEHRLFLTATPHNGHSNSFSALLEILDPDRFCRGVRVRKSDLEPIAVRRLKEDLRALGPLAGRFPRRVVEAIRIEGLPDDHPLLELPKKLDAYRKLIEQRVTGSTASQRAAALLSVATLQHRLLSSIEAFARTLSVHRRAIERQHEGPRRQLSQKVLEMIARQAAPPGPDDAEETEERLGSPAPDAKEEAGDGEVEAVAILSEAGLSDLDRLDEALRLVDEMAKIAERHRHGGDPRIDWLLDWIDTHMCPGFRADPGEARWTDERLIVFTEWEHTRVWLERKLRAALERVDPRCERVAVFTGQTSTDTRERIQKAFNEPPERNPIRILICTDAAREGLNLQRHCNQLVHFDLPWNPARIEQRNGRIDRKLQPRDTVWCRYFLFTQRPEDRVLRVLVEKTERIREELGSLSPVLAETIGRRIEFGIRRERIDEDEKAIREADIPDPGAVAEEFEDNRDEEERQRRREALKRRVEQLGRALDRSRRILHMQPERLKGTLDTALRRFYGVSPLAGAGRETSIDGQPIDLFTLPDPDRLTVDRRMARFLASLRQETGELKPFTFTDPDRLGEDAEQLHLEHAFVRRLLARFQAQDLVEHHLRRACLATTPTARPRVVLLGRLTLFGSGAARLHEELVPVVAEWVAPERRRRPLQPLALGGEAEGRVLDELEEAFDRARSPAPDVREQLAASLVPDVEQLLPHLQERAAGRERQARNDLDRLARREADNLVKLLGSLRSRIEKALGEPSRQLRFDFTPLERRQLEAERREQERRLAALDQDMRERPARILEHYEIRARRLEPVGIVYLWPEG